MTQVTLERIGQMPMPIEVEVTYSNGETAIIYIPLTMMNWEKENLKNSGSWAWAYPTHTIELSTSKANIEKIEIDPSGLMADINRSNNVWEKE